MMTLLARAPITQVVSKLRLPDGKSLNPDFWKIRRSSGSRSEAGTSSQEVKKSATQLCARPNYALKLTS